MTKIMKPFRLEEATVQNLERMAAASGKSQTELVEEGLALLANPTISKRIDAVYQMVGAQMAEIEIIRDHQRKLTEAEQVFYNWLHRAWDSLRELPGFWEPRFLETDLNDYVLDSDGEMILDSEHEKTRPVDM